MAGSNFMSSYCPSENKNVSDPTKLWDNGLHLDGNETFSHLCIFPFSQYFPFLDNNFYFVLIAHRIGWIVSGVFAFVATVISFYLIIRHCQFYYKVCVIIIMIFHIMNNDTNNIYIYVYFFFYMQL